MLTVIHLNGSINSGKSSVGHALADLLPDAIFIDGDDHDAPDDAPLTLRIQTALRRIETKVADATGYYLIVAYPLDQTHYDQLRAASGRRGARLLVLTLAPPLEVALSDRGTRSLTPEERERILEMYEEGYQSRPFSDAVIDTAGRTPKQSAKQAAEVVLALRVCR
ncbi:shikimate kinase [Microvirga sesbaniae]|uniref:shikimate kinase n=1 Tax=Microvirga sesbaniae TaxID=681392 RepID=UPI0021C799B2|nr:shikimate kinase [Microvirga sp. HBU67692]